MEARYLRVKKWREFQHYAERRPPWIKLKRRLIEGERDFVEQLSEIEQWQLVRLWLYASGSETVMLDEKGREVPLVAYDEHSLRLGIKTLKKIPLEKFIRQGWLEVVSEDEITASFAAHSDPDIASTIASAFASTDASTRASTAPLDPVAVRPPERTEGAEDSEKDRPSPFEELPVVGDPCEVLISLLTDGDAHTPRTVRSFQPKLPPAAFAQVLVQLRDKRPRNKTRYAVKTLSTMVKEGQYAA